MFFEVGGPCIHFLWWDSYSLPQIWKVFSFYDNVADNENIHKKKYPFMKVQSSPKKNVGFGFVFKQNLGLTWNWTANLVIYNSTNIHSKSAKGPWKKIYFYRWINLNEIRCLAEKAESLQLCTCNPSYFYLLQTTLIFLQIHEKWVLRAVYKLECEIPFLG